MGRHRKTGAGLPARLYQRRGTWFYAHRDTGRWENLGTDEAAARRRAEHYNDPRGVYGTLAWWLEQWLIDCEQRVAAGTLASRTLADYRAAVGTEAKPGPLRAYFGAMLPAHVLPSHVSDYLAIGAKAGRPVPANRERAALSACFSWLLRTRQGHLASGQANPCMRASGVRRNRERPRDVYVEHAWFRAVYAVANPQVRLMMELVYRTLQRPDGDVLAWTAANIQRKAGQRVLRFTQSKTGQAIDIALVGELERLVDAAVGPVPVLHQPILHTVRASTVKRGGVRVLQPAGSAYTYDGISAELKRAIAKARLANPELAGAPGFGFRDLKGKGATDMWRAGEPLERIQLLCGHAKITTTEVYVKQRWRETAQPNSIEVHG